MEEDDQRRSRLGPEEASGRSGSPSSTRFGAHPGLAEAGGERPFASGAKVRVRRLRTRQLGGDRIGDLGTGRLMESVAVGRPLRVEVNWGPALVTSPVRTVERLGIERVRVLTVNSAYEIERLEGSESAPLPPSAAAGAPREPVGEAEPELVLEEVVEEGEDRGHATGFVSVERLSQADQAPFGAGTRVRVWRCKLTAAGADDVFEALGTGRLLDRVEAGAAVRLAVDGGPTFVTSPLRRLRLLDRHRIQFETTNSIYRLERLPAKATPPVGPS